MKKKSNKILITGVYGYIGSQIFNYLSKKYKNIYGIGRRKKNQKKIPSCHSKNLSFSNLKKIGLDADIIIHCAGSGSVKESSLNLKKDFKDTINSTRDLVKYYNKFKKNFHLIYISSAAVYGERKYQKKKLVPISIYGKNKLKAENIIISNNNKKFTYSILRVFSLFGIGLRKQLIWDTCKKLKKNNFNFYGSGNEIRSWISINKLNSYVDNLIKDKKTNSIEDIAGDFSIKNKLVIKYIMKLMKINKEPFFNKINRKGDPEKLIPDKNSLSKKIKFSKSDFFNELKKYIKWYNENN